MLYLQVALYIFYFLKVQSVKILVEKKYTNLSLFE